MGSVLDVRHERRGDATGWSVPLSLVLSVLFVGLHFVVYLLTVISTLDWSEAVYVEVSFGRISLVTGVLLLAYLGLDFWRWKARGTRERVYYLVFGGTAVLLVAMLIFLYMAATGS